jgi:DNA adenine methylase
VQTTLFEARESYSVKPFLRWAGGKTWLVTKLIDYLPKKFNNYHEPFLGGGAVFLYLKSKGHINANSYLSDLNDELINAYDILKTNKAELFTLLGQFSNDSECYYRVRSSEPTSLLEKAAKFIYLNRTSYNGIYRINRKGQYNVPFGRREISVLFEYENMENISAMIQNATFSSSDFFSTIDNVQEGDLVFLDPPYTIAHEHNGFIEYNHKIFAWEDQERLKEYIEILNQKRAYFILTNAAHFSIENLYSGIGKQQTISRYSTIGGTGAKRVPCNEFIYTNFSTD